MLFFGCFLDSFKKSPSTFALKLQMCCVDYNTSPAFTSAWECVDKYKNIFFWGE